MDGWDGLDEMDGMGWDGYHGSSMTFRYSNTYMYSKSTFGANNYQSERVGAAGVC